MKEANTTKKPIEEVAKEVIGGKWGVGAEIKRRLTLDGYDFLIVLNKVKELSGVDIVDHESRISKHNYYLDIAESVSQRSTCLRRKFGAVIVKNDEFISSGYNGAPRGRKNCDTIGKCIRDELNIPRGERYELCRSVHAEANAIISASRSDMIGSALYLAGTNQDGSYIDKCCSCSMCKRLIINAGIEKVYVRTGINQTEVFHVSSWVVNDESLEGKFGY